MSKVVSKSVELRSGVVNPGDLVMVNADGYHRPGIFRGLLGEKLAVKVNLSRYSQTTLFLRKGEVETKVPS